MGVGPRYLANIYCGPTHPASRRIAGQEGVHWGTSQTKARGERRPSEKDPFPDGNSLCVVVSMVCCAGAFAGDHAGADGVGGGAFFLVECALGRNFVTR